MVKNIQMADAVAPRRIETGPVQFDGDWPGVFFRGDDALGKASELRALAAHIRAGMTGIDIPKYLDGLASEFAACSIDETKAA